MASPKTRSIVHKASLLSKFKGCLAGAVVGDCLGAHFEMIWDIKVKEVKNFFENLKKKRNMYDEHKGLNKFTDDTAMARSVATSLIERKGLNVKDMAQRFVDEYIRENWRGYGGNVTTVFWELKHDNCENPHQPASEQFNGQGSYGNGAAMRIAPAALYGVNMEPAELNKMVEDISKITHTHQDAIVGAQLECLAIHRALNQQGSTNSHDFLKNLLKELDLLEVERLPDKDSPPSPKRKVKDQESVQKPYSSKLKNIDEFLRNKIGKQSVIEKALGNDVSALGSVPAAIFTYLHCLEPIEDFETENSFERTIMYAISLGGDTDTIATMAGAIAGAHNGIEIIPQLWLDSCEGVKDALQMAEDLYSLIEDADKKS